MKSIKKNSIILLIITIGILVYILKDNFNNIIDELFKMNKCWLLCAFLLIIIYWIFKAFSLYIISRKYSKRVKFRNIVKQIIITQFFNGVTPFSTGGQPMQIYMLSKNDISIANSTNVVLQEFIVYQIALVLFGMFALITNAKLNYFVNSTYLKKLVALGFAVNTIVCLIVVVFCFSKKISRTLVSIALKILKKLKFLKNEKKLEEKIYLKTEEFHSSAKIYIQNKRLFFSGILINIIALFVFYSIPIILIKGMNIQNDISLLCVIVSSAYVLLIGSFVPIPGGSVGIEFGFMTFFGNFIFSSELAALLLVWRFVTYYFGIIMGGILFNLYRVGD